MREKPLVLIIDDEADLREILRLKLEANNFEVQDVGNGFAGVNMAMQLKPDVIILDVVMPDLDGVATLFKLKENEDTKHIRVFLYTGKGEDQKEIVELNRRFAKESGAVDFIRKEEDLDEVVAKINKAVDEDKKIKA